MKIDAHQHFWRYEPAEYPWIEPARMKVLQRDFLPEHLRQEQEPLGFHGSVAVQARQSLAESRWLLSLADRSPRVMGVVGWVDLQSDMVEAQLAELSSHPKWVGVRHVVQDEPDDDFMLQPRFLHGLSCLPTHNLTYDLLIYPRQLGAALTVARQFPGQPFVLDHMAKPEIRRGLLSPWKEQMKELASHPNVYCKVSGLVTEAAWEGWKPYDFRPYLDVVFEAFGVERLMFGSDWPVCLLSGRYRQVYEIVDEYLGKGEERVRRKIFGENAARFYGLPRGHQ